MGNTVVRAVGVVGGGVVVVAMVGQDELIVLLGEQRPEVFIHALREEEVRNDIDVSLGPRQSAFWVENA